MESFCNDDLRHKFFSDSVRAKGLDRGAEACIAKINLIINQLIYLLIFYFTQYLSCAGHRTSYLTCCKCTSLFPPMKLLEPSQLLFKVSRLSTLPPILSFILCSQPTSVNISGKNI